jgi:hypothetical protein
MLIINSLQLYQTKSAYITHVLLVVVTSLLPLGSFMVPTHSTKFGARWKLSNLNTCEPTSQNLATKGISDFQKYENITHVGIR